ncbi:uncharacterized protein LOC144872634 isoform X2 [Branchiostoma floridae x Branchiostoma japonicum]
MAARGKLWGLFLQLTAVLSAVPGEQGLDLRCLQACNFKFCGLAKCAAERTRRDADDYPQSGACEPWPFSGHNLPYVPASPTDLREVERITGDCTVNGVDMKCEGVTVEWKAGLQGIRDLRGFKASILKPGSNNNCYQLILPESVVADSETIYNHTFFPIFPGESYTVSVLSLPLNYQNQDDVPPARIPVPPRTCAEVNADNPCTVCGGEAWIPRNINITVTGRTVDVNFPVAPVECDIDEYHILIWKMTCEESEFNCSIWRDRDTCNGGTANDLPGGAYKLVQSSDGQVVHVPYDEVPPGKYFFEVRGDFGQSTCPTVFKVSDWAPPVDSITIREDTWNCSAAVSFPPDDDVPSYRVCMDGDCASVNQGAGGSVSHTFQTVQPYHDYQVKVSDGRYADARNTTKAFTSMQEFTPNLTDLVVTANDDSSGISVTFESPACIREYTVNVCQTSDLVCMQEENHEPRPADEGFPWVTLDVPLDSNVMGSWKSIRFKVKVANMENAREAVTVIELHPEQSTTKRNPSMSINISQTPTSPTFPPYKNDGWKFGAVAGGVAAAVVLAIVLLCCWKHPQRLQLRKLCSDTDNNFQPAAGMHRYFPSANTLTASLPDIRLKTVLLLASYDCVEHRTVVLSFAAYLQRECHCEVILDLHKAEDIAKLGPMDWLVNHIRDADFVIVICSVGTKFKATKNKKARELHEIEPCGDLFTGGLKHISHRLHSQNEDMSKFINVFFPYSSKTDVPETLEIARTFKLMESMPALFCHIHGHPQFSMDGAAHIGIAEQVGSTESGCNLLSAIKKMKDKDAAEPDWFNKRILSASESDSGHGSFSKTNNNNNKRNINPTDKEEEETFVKVPADVSLAVDDEASRVNVTVDDDAMASTACFYDGYGDENDGYCPSIPMTRLNNGMVQFDHFQPQPDAYAYSYSAPPEQYVPEDMMMMQPPGPPYQPAVYPPELGQFAPYGNQQDLDARQSPYEYEDALNNQQVRQPLKLYIPDPSSNPPQGLHAPQGPDTGAITPESGCYSGESIEDQLQSFNLQSQAAFSELQV